MRKCTSNLAINHVSNLILTCLLCFGFDSYLLFALSLFISVSFVSLCLCLSLFVYLCCVYVVSNMLYFYASCFQMNSSSYPNQYNFNKDKVAQVEDDQEEFMTLDSRGKRKEKNGASGATSQQNKS